MTQNTNAHMNEIWKRRFQKFCAVCFTRYFIQGKKEFEKDSVGSISYLATTYYFLHVYHRD